MWYAAHVILAYRYAEGTQTEFPVQENVYLVQADSFEEAYRTAERLGQEEGAYDKPSAVYDGVPVRLAFEGVRRVVECLPNDRLETGTELTYTEYLVDSEDGLKDLVAGHDVPVVLQDFEDDTTPPG